LDKIEAFLENGFVREALEGLKKVEDKYGDKREGRLYSTIYVSTIYFSTINVFHNSILSDI
jgi:hypothetical protein